MKHREHQKHTCLAPSLEYCLAKTRITSAGTSCSGRTVEEHCRIAGAVAQDLLSRLPSALRSLFPKNSARPALVHDIGKVCPTFQNKIYTAAGIPLSTVPELDKDFDPVLERQWNGHAAVSYSELHLEKNAAHIDEIVGQHHGFSTVGYAADSDFFGGVAWHERRQELLKKLLTGAGEEVWPIVTDSAETLQLIAGLTIVADWIASGPIFDDPGQSWEPLVTQAVNDAGFVQPKFRCGLSFEDVFLFSPRESQTNFINNVVRPGVYILEAPMGVGKTESALYAAYQLMTRGVSTGIYFALPTQLTSNNMYTRLESFLKKILFPDEKHHALLLHSKSWLTSFLQQDMGGDAAPNEAWFHGNKRGILAPFAVGTVNQALMSVMHVRHSAVRTFGLAGKTVILDEVHSYDTYTGTILDALVERLRRCGCTVIILSATLTAERRAAFTGKLSRNMNYPLITASTDTLEEIPCRPPQNTKVALCHVNDTDAVEEALLRAEQGQQVLWVENTVAESQKRYLLFSARTADMHIPVGLLHSRFTQADRARNEATWTALYGKEAKERSETGRILVGTQVLEQSLDIDADFLVTRFCPTDMLLQRLGRLWRHPSAYRPAKACREAWLLHPALADALSTPNTAFGSTGHVYAPYVLCRSLELWNEKKYVILPTEIRSLLESTYISRTEQLSTMASALRDVALEKEKLHNIALHGIAKNGSIQLEDTIQTRAGQIPTVDVLLFRSLDRENGKAILADGSTVWLDAPYSWRNRRANALQLSLNIVRIPEYLAPKSSIASELKLWLARWIHCVDKHTGEILLQVALIAPSFSLTDFFGNEISHTSYRSDCGYIKEEK